MENSFTGTRQLSIVKIKSVRYLSEARNSSDGFSVRLGPGDVGQRHSASLADDLGSCSEVIVSLGN